MNVTPHVAQNTARNGSRAIDGFWIESRLRTLQFRSQAIYIQIIPHRDKKKWGGRCEYFAMSVA